MPAWASATERRWTTAAELEGPVLVESGARVGAAAVGPRAVIGQDGAVEASARITGSVLLAGCSVGAGATVDGAILGAGVQVGEGARIAPGAVIGDGARNRARRRGRARRPCGARSRSGMSEAPTAADLLAEIRAVDEQGQLDDVLALPDHLADALFRVESARIAEVESSGLVVCGMGGSAIGGDLARAAFGDRLMRPLQTVRDYTLAPWTPPDRAVLCASYSGNTEETLACFEAASAVGATRIVATTGGALGAAAREANVPVIPFPAALQPRAAVGYMFVAAAEVAALVKAAAPIRTEIDGAAAGLTANRDRLVAQAAELADGLEGTVPVIYGCGLTAPVAYRWKTQVNENAKQPAGFHVLPEMDHNEIVGWTEGSGAEQFSAVFLTDQDQHPRERERIELTAELIEPAAARVEVVETQGETRTERMLGAVLQGDLLSLFLAARRGVDPSPVPVIESLKDRLGRP